ncbi:hypothetical protein OK016_01410 [Vibrio chagasii]|nr:hypothetical protein [Vibrio chagasii]
MAAIKYLCDLASLQCRYWRNISPQIINGNEEATKGSWPFMKYLFQKTWTPTKGSSRCNFIGERYCTHSSALIEASSSQDFEVVIGLSDLSS